MVKVFRFQKGELDATERDLLALRLFEPRQRASVSVSPPARIILYSHSHVDAPHHLSFVKLSNPIQYPVYILFYFSLLRSFIIPRSPEDSYLYFIKSNNRLVGPGSCHHLIHNAKDDVPTIYPYSPSNNNYTPGLESRGGGAQSHTCACVLQLTCLSIVVQREDGRSLITTIREMLVQQVKSPLFRSDYRQPIPVYFKIMLIASIVSHFGLLRPTRKK